jgi:hypothetical protein
MYPQAFDTSLRCVLHVRASWMPRSRQLGKGAPLYPCTTSPSVNPRTFLSQLCSDSLATHLGPSQPAVPMLSSLIISSGRYLYNRSYRAQILLSYGRNQNERLVNYVRRTPSQSATDRGSSSARTAPRHVILCGPNVLYDGRKDVTKRLELFNLTITIYGWPSRGGVIVFRSGFTRRFRLPLSEQNRSTNAGLRDARG